MNVYELVAGNLRHFVVAADEQAAREQGEDPERFPDIHFRPFEVKLVQVEGYTITVKKEAEDGAGTATGKRRGKQAEPELNLTE